jgi:hypothetical protein
MPEMNFHLDEKETQELIEIMLSDGSEFIPNTHFPSSDIYILDNYYKINEFFFLRTHFFVLNVKYKKSSLDIRYVDGEGKEMWVIVYSYVNVKLLPKVLPSKGFWYVNSRNGGPTIDIKYSNFEEKNNIYIVKPGNIGYYTYYWDTLENENLKPPKELIDLYNKYIKFIKKKTIAIKPKNSAWRFWFSKSFLEKARQEKKVIMLWDEKLLDEEGNLHERESLRK